MKEHNPINILKLSIIVLCLTKINQTVSYKILAAFPYAGKSHFLVFTKITEELARVGHNVTVISQFPLKSPLNPKHYHDIVLEQEKDKQTNMVPVEMDGERRYSRYHGAYELYQDAGETCENFFKSENVQKFLKIEQHFDLLLTEFFHTDCTLALADKYNVPIVGLQSCTLMPWTSSRFANPVHPGYIPNNFLVYSDRMSFLERVENTLAAIVHQVSYDYFFRNQDEMIIEKYYGKLGRSLEKITYKNSSLVLVNTHFSLSLARPLVPNVIEVGGVHIGDSKRKKAPDDIEKWINESTAGVIYFSLGSMIKGHTFPEEKRQAFLKAFARLPQRVLWKWENDTMKGKPDNVMIQNWMPQFDILSHPNVKAFISHGGLLGTTESVHCGVPMLVMPQYGDQHLNARAVESSGGGLRLYLSQANEDSIYNSLKKLLEPEFQQQAQELSDRFRDRPMSPLDTAIYWIEYVARHKGARHMRTAAVDMPFYQYYLLDVFAFLFAILFAVLYVFYRIVKLILSVLFRNGGRAGTKTKQKMK